MDRKMITTILLQCLSLKFSQFVDSSESGNWGCYGNIRTLDTPGAACGVGRRRGLNYCGSYNLNVFLALLLLPLRQWLLQARVAATGFSPFPLILHTCVSQSFPHVFILSIYPLGSHGPMLPSGRKSTGHGVQRPCLSVGSASSGHLVPQSSTRRGMQCSLYSVFVNTSQ